MEIRDPVHGPIEIREAEIPITQHPFFQRLRHIKQLGFSETIFPGATHTRYLHSLGVMHVSQLAFNKLFSDRPSSNELKKLEETLRLACLLHDIGHAPLSHTTEFVMPKVKDLKLPKEFLQNIDPGQQATHEDYTVKIITDSSFTKSLQSVIEHYNVSPLRIADLIQGSTQDSHYFTMEGVNYFPLLHQLVSSEMDCDRMDYLLRDSYFCGVSYGKFDLDWIIDNLDFAIDDQKAYLGINERTISTFDDFLLSRFHMFVMVYFHYKSVCLEEMLKEYFEDSPDEYIIPADIEKYLEHDDRHLLKILQSSSNPTAQNIFNNMLPKKIFESFGHDLDHQLFDLEKYLDQNGIPFIKSSSQGRLSKYYNELKEVKREFPLKVIRISTLNPEHRRVVNIDQATDLYKKFSQTHTINRIHLHWNQLSLKRQKDIQEILEG